MSRFAQLVEKLIHSFRMAAKNQDHECIWSMWAANSGDLCREYEQWLTKKEISEAVYTARELFYAYN